MNVVLLVNEASGSGTDAADLEAALRAEGADVRRLPLDRRGEAAAAGPAVVVAGGDGSVAPAADAAGALGVPLALVRDRYGQRLRAADGALRRTPGRPAGWPSAAPACAASTWPASTDARS